MCAILHDGRGAGFALGFERRRQQLLGQVCGGFSEGTKSQLARVKALVPVR